MQDLINQYNALDGKTVTRAYLVELFEKMESLNVFDNELVDNNINFFIKKQFSEATEKLENLLYNNHHEQFKLTIANKVDLPIGLGAPRHEGIAKEALDECGRLKPGYKYSQGRILKVSKKTKKSKEKTVEKAPTETTKVVKLQPIKKPVLKTVNQVKKQVTKDLGGDDKLNNIKRMFTLLEDYAAALKNDAVIPFREAKILWHEGKQVYEDKPAYSFKELHQYILDIWKAQSNPLFDFGYDKLKVNIEWAEDFNMDFRMDLGFSDFYPLEETPEEYIKNYIFYKAYQAMFDDLTQDFGFSIKTDDVNKLALLQFGDDYDAFDYITFLTRGNMYLMKNYGNIKYPNLYIHEQIKPNFKETSAEWVEIIKDYAKEIGRTPAVKTFLDNSEYNFETKRDLIYANNLHKLKEKKDIPITIETKSFDIQKTTDKFQQADRRKTTSLLKRYLKDVFRIKTSIKSEVYSGGSSLNVSYNLGPRPDLITPIINRLQYGRFNGMDDSYNVKGGSERGFYLDNYELEDFKYTFVDRDFSDKFMIMAAKAFSNNHNYGEKIPTFNQMKGNTDRDKLSDLFKEPINHRLNTYYYIVREILKDANFETQDYKEIKNLTYKEDRKDDNLSNWFNGYFTYTIKGKKYDTRQFKEGTSKLVKPHKAVIKNIQIINVDKTQFAVVGYLEDIKDQLLSIGGEYRKTVNIKGFSENLNAVFFHKKHLEAATNVVLEYVGESGLNAPGSKNNYKYEYEFLKTIGLTGPQHTGIAKEALDNCSRLKPGYKFKKGGGIKIVDSINTKKDVSKLTLAQLNKINKTYLNDILWTEEVTKYVKKVRSEIEKRQKKKDAPKGLKISINPIQIAPTTLTNQKPTVQPNTENMGVFSVAVPEVLDNTPKHQEQPKQEAVPTPTPKPNNNTIASKLSQQRTRQFFSLKPQFADLHTFLGKVERPAKESVVFTLSGPQGCGKTTAIFDAMNAFATSGYNVLHASLEEHPDSYLYEQKAVKYLSPEAQQRIKAPAYSSSNKAQILKDIEEADVIVIDSMKKMWQYFKGFDLDNDLRKKYNGKLFIIIFQLTSDGKMRGGSDAQFDGDIITFIEKHENFNDNYIYHDKNRFAVIPIHLTKYNIASQRLVKPEQEAPAEAPKSLVFS